MKAIGYALIALSIFLYWEGFKGRALTDVFQDMKDITRSLVSLDFDGVTEAASRSGTLTDDDSEIAKTTSRVGKGSATADAIVKRSKELGSRAIGYRLGASGPGFYDCSGLIYRAMKDVGYYDGPRFATYTFRALLRNKIEEVDAIRRGDILLWNGHMGIAESPDTMYHAASVKSGIRSDSISVMKNALRSKYGEMRVYRLL